MGAEAWGVVAAVLIAVLGAFLGAAFWAHRVYTTQTELVVEFRNFNANFLAFETRNEKDHGELWNQVKSQNDLLHHNGERISRVEAKIT